MIAVIIIVSLLAFCALIFLLLPAIKPGLIHGHNYYISGATDATDILLKKRIIAENIRDLQIERDYGKLSEDEFRSLLHPLVAELSLAEQRVDGGKAKKEGTKKRLCPFCMMRNQTVRCIQCGAILS